MRTGCWAAWAKHETFGFCGLPIARPVTSADTVSQYPRDGVQESPVLMCVNLRAGLHVAVIGQ
jgi:hypothetical protein